MSLTRLAHRLSAHTCCALALLCLAAVGAPSAHATAYWTSLSGGGEIANGVNGFSNVLTGGAWSNYGNTCETKVSSYAAGAYCKFRFTPPAGTTALEGIARGTYSIANANMVLRSERPAGSPTYVLDSTTKGDFAHGFGVLGYYFDLGLVAKSATSMSGAYNWFHINSFQVRLDDPSVPVFGGASFGSASAGGWYGAGCAGGTYSWSDTGSQLWATSLTNATTGQGIHGWTANPGMNVVASGVPTATFSTCISAPGTGTYTFISAAQDRAGNTRSDSFAMKFDVTSPLIGAPEYAGAPVSNGREFASTSQYRPAITWPNVVDQHSGLASVTASFNGAGLPVTMSGSTAVLAPSANLPLGSGTLRLRVVDAVGNVAVLDRTIVIRDDVAPVIEVASPSENGNPNPVLDVSATDDFSGLDAPTWTVTVDGEVLVAASETNRLQAAIGLLADGGHTIRVTIADKAGNIGARTIVYVADSGPDVPQLPEGFITGIYVFGAPTTSTPGQTHRFRAVMVKNGRPITGRAEIREGNDTIASKELEANGTVDMAITVNKVRTELTYNGPSGVGLAAVNMVVNCPTFGGELATPSGPTPAEGAQPAAQQMICSPRTAACAMGYPSNVIYYIGSVPMWNGVPLAESGARLDHIAPSWKLALVQQRAGAFRRTRKITLRLWTNEFAVVSIMPMGSKNRMTISPRRTSRTIQVLVAPSSSLGRRIARQKAGSVMIVKLRIVASDRNDNRTVPKVVSFRIRV